MTIKAINLKLNTLAESVDPNLLTRDDNSSILFELFPLFDLQFL